MTAALYQFPVSCDLRAARLVVANPTAHDPDVLDTALTVIDWHGTDADREKIAHFPNTDLITGRKAHQLAEARRIAAAAGAGETQSLPALLTAQEVLETHGVAEDSVALAQVEAAAMLARMRARKVPAGERGLIRGELGRFAVLLAFGAAVAVVMLGGGPL